MERCGKLNPLCDVDLFCLHFVFIPRINNALSLFQTGWNNHAITTEHCKTPLQLFTSGTLARGPSQELTSVDHSNYQQEVDVSSGVVVPEVNSPLNNQKEDELRSLINPLTSSTNNGIELFDQTKMFVLNNM